MGLRSRKIGWFPSQENTSEPTPPTEVFRMLNDSFLTTGADWQNPVVGDVLWPDHILWRNDFVDDPVDIDSIVHQWSIGSSTYNGKSLLVNNSDGGKTISYTATATLVSGQTITETVNITTNAVTGSGFHPNDGRDYGHWFDYRILADWLNRPYDTDTDPNKIRETRTTSLKTAWTCPADNLALEKSTLNGVDYLAGVGLTRMHMVKEMFDGLIQNYNMIIVYRNRDVNLQIANTSFISRYQNNNSDSDFGIRLVTNINSTANQIGGTGLNTTIDGEWCMAQWDVEFTAPDVFNRRMRGVSASQPLSTSYTNSPNGSVTVPDERHLRLNAYGGGTSIANPNDAINLDFQDKDIAFVGFFEDSTNIPEQFKDDLWTYLYNNILSGMPTV